MYCSSCRNSRDFLGTLCLRLLLGLVGYRFHCRNSIITEFILAICCVSQEFKLNINCFYVKRLSVVTVVVWCCCVLQNYPDKSYLPMTMIVYLPASGDGKEAHRLMKQAFDARRLFRVHYRDSEIGKLVPNDVEFKTEVYVNLWSYRD